MCFITVLLTADSLHDQDTKVMYYCKQGAVADKYFPHSLQKASLNPSSRKASNALGNYTGSSCTENYHAHSSHVVLSMLLLIFF